MGLTNAERKKILDLKKQKLELELLKMYSRREEANLRKRILRREDDVKRRNMKIRDIKLTGTFKTIGFISYEQLVNTKEIDAVKMCINTFPDLKLSYQEAVDIVKCLNKASGENLGRAL